MKKVINVTPNSGRYLILSFEGEIELRVYDTILLREGIFEKLDDESFFNCVKVDETLSTVTWEREMDLDPDVLFEESTPINKIFNNFFDVEEAEESRNVIHDAYYDLIGHVPDKLKINKILKEIPIDIKSVAMRWSWYDTEVRENVYEWIEKEKDKIIHF